MCESIRLKRRRGESETREHFLKAMRHLKQRCGICLIDRHAINLAKEKEDLKKNWSKRLVL
ncbi:protein of unknown function [Methylocaldum szegediense]|uniref:Transposase n=1 Tax=Methylocaldum szegediense TaxID=73780 RepID=A0ABN8WZW3_9GAMM|nr:protein of unknown function [Methylocaldum szegediense]